MAKTESAALRKKDLGAFYTPAPYARLGAQLVREAIERVPEGNDYVIIDRCAGSGNLEASLTEEELSHCVASSYEKAEHDALVARLGNKLRKVLPLEGRYENGVMATTDALTADFIANPDVKRYLDDPKTSIILFENPPYAEANSVENQKRGRGKASAQWKSKIVPQQMREWVRAHDVVDGRSSNEMANAFIWSAFEYYLRRPGDCYIVYAPAKYWKFQHVVDREFNGGYVMNRKHFDATADAALMCVSWGFENVENESLELRAFDIVPSGGSPEEAELIDKGEVTVPKTHSVLSSFADTRKFPDDEPGIACGYNGIERMPTDLKNPLYNENAIAYLSARGATFETPRLTANLIRVGLYIGHGFYLRRDNYLDKLPLFAAAKYDVEEDWRENGTIYKSADGGDAYVHDEDLRRMSLVYACLSYFNKCLSFTGSDGRFYRNELCFDGKTIASTDLAGMKTTQKERDLLSIWDEVLSEAKKSEAYDPNLTYGVYQIALELDTTAKNPSNGGGKASPDNPRLHELLAELRKSLNGWYKSEVVPKLFEYELLK